jgi:hypothetical protein
MNRPGLTVTIALLAAFIFMPNGEVSPVAPYFIIGGFALMGICAAIGAYVDRQR